MQIVDLTQEHEESYFNCLGDGTSEFSVGACRKRAWFEKVSREGLRVKLALDDGGTPIGMIQYGPEKLLFNEDKGLHFIQCVWVLRRSKTDSYQKRGIGKALLHAVEDDVKQLGSKGLAAWGVSLPFFMRASWFKRQGFRKIDRKGTAVLLWKPYSPEAEPIKWEMDLRIPSRTKGRVDLTILSGGWCTVMNANVEHAIRAAAEFGDKVVVHEIDTNDRKNLIEWGQSDAIFLNGKQIATGPPWSYEQFHKVVERQVRKEQRRPSS